MLAELHGSFVQSLLLGGLLVFVVAASLYDHRTSPLRKLEKFRLRSAPNLRFHRLAWAAIYAGSSRMRSYRATLSTGLDRDWVYLKYSRWVPFFPAYYRVPRELFLPSKEEGMVVIHVTDPPFKADFGEGFVKALSYPESRRSKPKRAHRKSR